MKTGSRLYRAKRCSFGQCCRSLEHFEILEARSEYGQGLFPIAGGLDETGTKSRYGDMTEQERHVGDIWLLAMCLCESETGLRVSSKSRE